MRTSRRPIPIKWFSYMTEGISFFDADETPLEKPEVYVFDSLQEFEKWLADECDCNIVGALSVSWINGERNDEPILKARG